MYPIKTLHIQNWFKNSDNPLELVPLNYGSNQHLHSPTPSTSTSYMRNRAFTGQIPDDEIETLEPVYDSIEHDC